MMFGGKNMGGGVGGGHLLRSVGRAVTRTNFNGGPISSSSSSSSSSSRQVNNNNTGSSSSKNGCNNKDKDKDSNNNNNNNQLLASPPFASCNVPVSPVATWQRCEEVDWVSVDGFEEDDGGRVTGGFGDEFVLGPVPSEGEVHSAVSALQRVFCPDYYPYLVWDKFGSVESSTDEEHQVINPTNFTHHTSPPGSEIDWIEPSLCMCSSKVMHCNGSEKVYDAFRLLRAEPLVQKMVKSLSSDEAVWNAVLNNEVVKELRESFSADDIGSKSQDGSSVDIDDADKEMNIVKWIVDGARAKIVEVIDKISKLVNDLFQLDEGKVPSMGGSDEFKEKLRTSFMISVMVLLVVVVARAHRA